MVNNSEQKYKPRKVAHYFSHTTTVCKTIQKLVLFGNGFHPKLQASSKKALNKTLGTAPGLKMSFTKRVTS